MTEPAPIILLGAARSGTKFLRDCLAAGCGAATVPYDVNYIWRYGMESYPHDRLDPAELTEKARNFIRTTLPKMAKAEAGDVLIEKSVSNTLRVPYVNAVFPNALFVHLIRDGRDVAESDMRQWTAPPDKKALWFKLRGMPLANTGYALWYAKNLIGGKLKAGRAGGKVWGPRYPGIEADVKTMALSEICAWQWRHSVEFAQRDLAALDPVRVHHIRYEDLIAGPKALDRLATALNLPDTEGTLAARDRTLRIASASAWPELPAADRAHFDHILSPPLKSLGYLS